MRVLGAAVAELTVQDKGSGEVIDGLVDVADEAAGLYRSLLADPGCLWCWTTLATLSTSAHCCPAVLAAWCWPPAATS